MLLHGQRGAHRASSMQPSRGESSNERASGSIRTALSASALPPLVDRRKREVMNAGDVSGGRSSSRETWLSSPLSDPNAALWASITPPANRDIPTLVRRRVAGHSLDSLAHRLHLRFPAYFSSRSTARTGILGAAVAFGATVGVVGLLALGAWQTNASESDEPLETSAVEALRPATGPASRPATAVTPLARQGASVDDAPTTATLPSGATSASAPATMTATAPLPPTFAATALPIAADAALSPRAQRRADLRERRDAARAKAKAKRLATAKAKAAARRATKPRRARALTK